MGVRVIPVLLLSACSGATVYVPQENAAAPLPGSELPQAVYKVPSRAPSGEMRITVMGVMKEASERALGVRYVVANASEDRWRVDPMQQRVTLADGVPREPVRTLSDGQAVDMVTVPAHGSRVVDLQYTLGPKDDLRYLSLHWTVATPGEYMTEVSFFERSQLQPKIAEGPPMLDGYYYTPPFHAPPAYPYYGFSSGVPSGPRPPEARTKHIVPAKPPIQVAPPGKL